MTHETHPVVFCVEGVPTMLSCDPEMFLRMNKPKQAKKKSRVVDSSDEDDEEMFGN